MRHPENNTSFTSARTNLRSYEIDTSITPVSGLNMSHLLTTWSSYGKLTDLQGALSHQADDVPPILQPQRVQPRLCDHTLRSSHHIGPILWSLCTSHHLQISL